MAAEAESRGNTDVARRHYLQIVKLDPNQAEAHYRLGVYAAKNKEYGAAAHYFEVAVKGAPHSGPIRKDLGISLYKDHEYERSFEQLNIALDLGERSFETRFHLAAVNFARGESELALEQAESLLVEFQGLPRIKQLRGEILMSQGRLEEAVDVFKQLVNDGKNLPRALYHLSLARKTDVAPPELDQAETLIASGKYESRAKVNLHFAAGKFSSDCGQYDRAFFHYVAGNEHHSVPFDINAYAELVDGLIEVTGPEFFEARKNIGSSSQQPIFIFGMPRSGTTLTEQIIGSHQRADAAGEINYFYKHVRLMGFDGGSAASFLEAVTNLDANDGLELANGYLALLKNRSFTADRVVDKMPHNFEQIWLLSLLFPKATFIHSIRHPLDTCLSCFTNQLSRFHEYATDLERLGVYYRLYDKLTRHWEKSAPVTILRSSYEDLVNSPEEYSRRLIAHTGLEWDEACARHYQAKSSVRTLSTWQVRQPVYKRSVYRWQKYEKHLAPLQESLGDIVANYESR